MALEKLGWSSFFESAWNSENRSGQTVARVAAQHRELWDIAGEFGSCRAEAAGKLRLAANDNAVWPAVGDWVAVTGEPDRGMAICEVLPRRTQIVRKVAGRRIAPQVLAANVDTIFVLMGLDGDFNPRRLERYLAQTWESGARIVVLLTKADVCEDPQARAAEIRHIAVGVDVYPVSVRSGEGIRSLEAHLASGQTVALLGSSGVGKSTLVNHLLHQPEQRTAPVRQSDSRGRHTTTTRQLFFLPGGSLLIDTPGLRELQLWEFEEGLGEAFADLEALARQCRFRDCSHTSEPGCAVLAAVHEGRLEQGRLENHRKLLREQSFLERKIDKGAQNQAKAYIKTINRAARKLYQDRDREGKQ